MTSYFKITMIVKDKSDTWAEYELGERVESIIKRLNYELEVTEVSGKYLGDKYD